MNTQNVTPHLPQGIGVTDFYKYLESDPKCAHFSQENIVYIKAAARLSEDIHRSDKPRKVSGEPYITHPIELALEEIKLENPAHWKSIVILLLHDALESAPERFREVFDIVPIDVFGRIIKLSKLSPATRIVIQDFLVEYIKEHPKINHSEYTHILEIITTDTSEKNKILLQIDEYGQGEFQNLLESYGPYLDKHCSELSQEKKDQEIDGLWHYIFFDRVDVRHKFRDTMHNLSDIHMMDSAEKQRYILRRIPKLQALAFVLRRVKMFAKLTQLKRQWQSVGGRFDHLGNFAMHDQSHEITTDTGEVVDSMSKKTEHIISK